MLLDRIIYQSTIDAITTKYLFILFDLYNKCVFREHFNNNIRGWKSPNQLYWLDGHLLHSFVYSQSSKSNLTPKLLSTFAYARENYFDKNYLLKSDIPSEISTKIHSILEQNSLFESFNVWIYKKCRLIKLINYLYMAFWV